MTPETSYREAPLSLRVFLASPGDVPIERVLARDVLENLKYDPGLTGRIAVEEVAWDHPGTDTPMLSTMTPQAAIAKGLPKPSDCDIVVVVFWSRMGTPLPSNEPKWLKPDGTRYASGTEWEYLDALDAHRRTGRPEVLVYRRIEKCLLDPADEKFQEKVDQWNTVQAFFKAFRNDDGSIRGGVNEYATPEDFRKRLDVHVKKLAHELLKVSSSGATPTSKHYAPPIPVPDWSGSPFPGLRAVTPDDAPIYFGRGRETDELVRLLADPTKRFIVVAGASGSGKSSLVAAGLIPRLKANAVVGSKDWLVPWTQSNAESDRKAWLGLRFTPRELGDPFLSVATKLAPHLPGEDVPPRVIAAELHATPTRFVERVAAVLAKRPDWAEVFVFIDQFEELLTVVSEAHRATFFDLLVAAAAAPRIRIVATIRADFYHRAIEAHPSFAEALRAYGASFPLAAPGTGALFEMITGPAARARLPLDDGLAQQLFDHTGMRPAAWHCSPSRCTSCTRPKAPKASSRLPRTTHLTA